MITQLTVHALVEQCRGGAATPSGAARAYLDRIAAVDPAVRAYITVTPERALAAAAAADARWRAGRPLSPIDGVPIAVKDLLCTKGVRTTCGSRILEHVVPPFDATLIERLARPRTLLPRPTHTH